MNTAILDYGAGNLYSLAKALTDAGTRVTVTTDWDVALGLDAVVLPGVGAFGAAVSALPADRERVRGALADGFPCLGICLGMQLLFSSSDEAEGEGEGIGLFGGRVRLLEASVVPQMGWNDVAVTDDPLFVGTDPLVAYYANSYVCEPEAADEVIAWSEHERTRYPAAVRRGHTWGVQFHPEKSSTAGRRLLANWVRLARSER